MGKKDRKDRQNLFEQRSLLADSELMDLRALSHRGRPPQDSLEEHVRKTDALARNQRDSTRKKRHSVLEGKISLIFRNKKVN
jgi:hypothetical protein